MFFHEFSGHSPVITAGLQGNEACPSAGLAAWCAGLAGWLNSSYGAGVAVGVCSYVIMFMRLDRCAEKYFAATDRCRLSISVFAPSLFNCISKR